MKKDVAYWNKRYLKQDTPWVRPYIEQSMQEVFKTYINPPKSILEIGCGLGTDSIWLAQQGHHVTAIDHSHDAIKQAQQNAQQAKVTINFAETDFFELNPHQQTFDVIYDNLTFHTFANESQRKLFSGKVASLLNPEGYWVNLSCNSENIVAIEKKTKVSAPPHLSLQELTNALSPYFEMVAIQPFTFRIHRPQQGSADFPAWTSIWKLRTN